MGWVGGITSLGHFFMASLNLKKSNYAATHFSFGFAFLPLHKKEQFFIIRWSCSNRKLTFTCILWSVCKTKERHVWSEPSIDHNQPLQNKVSQKRLKKTRATRTAAVNWCRILYHHQRAIMSRGRICFLQLAIGEMAKQFTQERQSRLVPLFPPKKTQLPSSNCKCGLHIVEVGWLFCQWLGEYSCRCGRVRLPSWDNWRHPFSEHRQCTLYRPVAASPITFFLLICMVYNKRYSHMCTYKNISIFRKDIFMNISLK